MTARNPTLIRAFLKELFSTLTLNCFDANKALCNLDVFKGGVGLADYSWEHYAMPFLKRPFSIWRGRLTGYYDMTCQTKGGLGVGTFWFTAVFNPVLEGSSLFIPWSKILCHCGESNLVVILCLDDLTRRARPLYILEVAERKMTCSTKDNDNQSQHRVQLSLSKIEISFVSMDEWKSVRGCKGTTSSRDRKLI